MITLTSQKIIEYIRQQTQATPAELVDYLQLSRQAVFKQLGKLLQAGTIIKIGTAPKVFYTLAVTTVQAIITSVVPSTIRDVITERYLYISPSGEMKPGLAGFEYWCTKTEQPVAKTATEYVQTLKKYDVYKHNGVISGLEKFRQSFTQVYLDDVVYLDFYSIERFGKTKLGQLLLYAKQSQNKVLMKQLTELIKTPIAKLLQQHHIDAVGFIPPTVKREVQLMKELAKQLQLAQRTIAITKVHHQIAVPQKTLAKLEDRIENARRTIVVIERQPAQNILLIDDAVGSGATLNETAAKLRQQHLCTGKIIGLAITGSFKGFDVITEV